MFNIKRWPSLSQPKGKQNVQFKVGIRLRISCLLIYYCFRYLRAQNPYKPPKNVPLLVDKLKESANLTTGFSGKKFSLEDKFNFLTLCANEFDHTVPNSVLHEINTISRFIRTLDEFMKLDL